MPIAFISAVKMKCFKIRPVSHTSQCPSSCTLWALHEYSWKGYIQMRLHFLSILLLEEEGQEAVESKFRINISADNPQSKWSTGMIIQCWQDTQFHRGLLLISWCQSTSTSVYFHGCFCSSSEVAGPGINPPWMLEILWQQLALLFAVSKMELPFFFQVRFMGFSSSAKLTSKLTPSLSFQ